MFEATAEMLVLPLVPAILLSLTAFFAGFFNPSFARKMCLNAAGFASLFVGWCCCLGGTHDLLALLLSAFLTAVFVLAFPPGSGDWLPLRVPGPPGADGKPASWRPRWALLVPSLVLVLGLSGYVAFRIIGAEIGEAKTRELMEGRQEVRLRSIQFDGGSRRVVCTDPECFRHLEAEIRRGRPRQSNSLLNEYTLTLTFEGGGSGSYDAFWWDDWELLVDLGYPSNGRADIRVRFDEPRPAGWDAIGRFLLRPTGEVAGTALVVGAGGSRVEPASSTRREGGPD